MLMMADRSNFKHIKEEDQVEVKTGKDLYKKIKAQSGKV